MFIEPFLYALALSTGFGLGACLILGLITLSEYLINKGKS